MATAALRLSSRSPRSSMFCFAIRRASSFSANASLTWPWIILIWAMRFLHMTRCLRFSAISSSSVLFSAIVKALFRYLSAVKNVFFRMHCLPSSSWRFINASFSCISLHSLLIERLIPEAFSIITGIFKASYSLISGSFSSSISSKKEAISCMPSSSKIWYSPAASLSSHSRIKR